MEDINFMFLFRMIIPFFNEDVNIVEIMIFPDIIVAVIEFHNGNEISRN
jgi:hypothetical protein